MRGLRRTHTCMYPLLFFWFYGKDEYIPGGIPIAGCPGLIIWAANCGDGAKAIAGLIICCINGIGVEATGT